MALNIERMSPNMDALPIFVNNAGKLSWRASGFGEDYLGRFLCNHVHGAHNEESRYSGEY